MATNNELSDVELVIDSSGLSDICAKWNQAILKNDLSSINVINDYSDLTQNEVGVNYIPSLDNALKRTDKLTLSINKLITTALEEQRNADSSGKKRSDDTIVASGINSNGAGSTNRGSDSANVVTTTGTEANNKNLDIAVNADANIDSVKTNDNSEVEGKENIQINTNQDIDSQEIDSTSTIDGKEDFKIINNQNINIQEFDSTSTIDGKKDFKIIKNNEIEDFKLEEKETIELVSSLQSIFEEDASNFIFDDSYADEIKKVLLTLPNISKDLKDKILEMDEKELQVLLRDMCVSGKSVSDFSKIIVTIFETDLKNNYNKKLSECADSIADVYRTLAKQDNFQEELKNIYNGNIGNEIASEVIVFTRDFVDTLAVSSNVSSDDILRNPKYGDTLLVEIKDLSNTLSIINEAENLGKKTAAALYSNIIVKEG